MMKSNVRRLFSTLAVAGVGLVLGTPAFAQPPGMPDPRGMSGIPRVDPNIPAGTVTVRCINGTFANPFVGATVTLEIRDGSGSSEKVIAATTQAQGRATFRGLESFLGKAAIASVTFEGESKPTISRPILLAQEAGTAVLLVKGAGDVAADPVAANPHGAATTPGGSDVPATGKPFPLSEREPGTLVIGTFSLAKSAPVPGGKIVLRPVGEDGTSADGEPVIVTTGDDGKAVFEKLLELPYGEGQKFVVEAQLDPKKPQSRSEVFEMSKEHGLAIVFMDQSAQSASSHNSMARPPSVPPPRSDGSLPSGSVRVLVKDGAGNAVANVRVVVIRSQMSSGDTGVDAMTNAAGEAVVSGVIVSPDSRYRVSVPYQTAPFGSTSFQLRPDIGARVEVRVFETTNDASLIRSAVQFDIEARENDMIRVIQQYEMLVEGDKAFWPQGGTDITAAGDGFGVRVMDNSFEYLAEQEEASYASLKHPIPPNTVIALSIAYLVRHDGTAELDWEAPFPLKDGRVAITDAYEVTGDVLAGSQSSPHPGSGQPIKFYGLDMSKGGQKVSLVAEGLPAQPQAYRWVAVGGTLVLFSIFGSAIVLGRNRSAQDTLRRRAAALVVRLRSLDPDRDQDERKQVIAALDNIYYRLDVFTKPSSSPDASDSTKAPKK